MRRAQVWPRYHQLDVVRKLLADASAQGVGFKYLIQHSAGSGKSNSIAWLAHQLIGLERRWRTPLRFGHRRHRPQDPRQANSRHHQTVRSGWLRRRHAQSSGHLRSLLQEGKRIVITPSRSFRSSSTPLATSTAHANSPSSSTKPTPARAAAPPRPSTWSWERPAPRRRMRRPKT